MPIEVTGKNRPGIIRQLSGNYPCAEHSMEWLSKATLFVTRGHMIKFIEPKNNQKLHRSIR